MKELPTPKKSIQSLFKNMVLLFDGEKYTHVDVVYQFVFTDIENGFPMYIRFSNGTAEFHEGLNDRPSVVIRTPSNVWLDISGGFRNPFWAMLTKKFIVQGSLSHLRTLPMLLTKKIETPRSLTFSTKWTNPSRALVLIGNPRKKNGLTGFYLEAFLDGMRKAGVQTEEIYLYDKKINHCLGCFACWTKTPGVCVQKDDQAELLEKLDTADMIVYALPLYYNSLPGLVKDHFDRQLPLHYPYLEKAAGLVRHPRRMSIQQSMVLFSICGFPEVEQFEPLVKTFEAYTRQENIPFAANVLLPGAMELYFNPTKRSLLLKKLEHLRSAGEQIITQGRVQKGTLKAISKVAHRGNWLDGANMYWHQETAAGHAGVL